MLLATLALAACGSGLSEEEAEDALRAAFEGDREESNKMFCPEEQVTETVPMPQRVVFKEVSCEKRGNDEMECTTAFQADGNEHNMVIVFKVEDGHLCDAQVQPEAPN